MPLVESEAEPLIDQACAALSERGVGFEIGSSFGAVLLPEEASDPSNALHVADERLYAQKHARRMETDRTMDALLEALSLREPDLPMHLDYVGSLAVETGLKLGLRRDELDELVRAAQLHDLGKLAVPDEILHKAGPLDEREWAFVRQHPLVGERILRASPAFRNVATIVRSTHERWDGAGYPDGFAGHEIPVASRIISVCDAFTAMTSARPYRAALSTDDALAELSASPEPSSTLRWCPCSPHTCETASLPSIRPSAPRSNRARYRASDRPRSSVDRATDFESVCGGSTPPGATSLERCKSEPFTPNAAIRFRQGATHGATRT